MVQQQQQQQQLQDATHETAPTDAGLRANAIAFAAAG